MTGTDATPEGPHIVVQDADGDDQHVSLGTEPLTLGRRTSNAVQILEPTVSREHARIEPRDDGWWIEDLESTHGTFVNDMRVRSRPLRHNDRVRLGKASSRTLIFRTHREFSDLMQTAERIEPTAENLRNLWALLEISKALNSSLRLDDVLEKVIEAVLALTRAERGMLLLGEDVEKLVVRVQRNFDTSESEEVRYSSSVVHDVFTTGRPRIITDALQDARFSGQESIVGMNLRTVMCAPLVSAPRISEAGDLEDSFELDADEGGAADATQFISASGPRGAGGEVRVIGAIYVDRRSPTRFFTDQDLALFESFSVHAALAIDNARLYEEALEKRRLERDIEFAREIQQSLLIRDFPALPWVESYGLNHASRQVGGDYYDVFRADDDTLGFAVGDVSGKGVPAALLMATLQSSFLAESSAHDDLATVCERMNQFLVQRTTPERYATFFTGRMGSNRLLRYVNAGHNPQLLLRGDEIHRLAGGGLPLGLFAGRTYEVQERQLEPGDLVVCFTDGVTEANDGKGPEFGEDRLVEVVRQHRDAPVTELTEEVFSAIEKHGGDLLNPHDDITLVILRVL